MSSYSTMKRSLEIELISGEGLKVNSKPLKKSKTYCIFKIDEKQQTSKLDESGESNPVWKDRISMDIPLNGSVRFISIEVFYRKSGGGQDKIVGYAKIPITDFLGGFAPPQGHLNFLSYRLRDEYGDKCGIVNVSIMVKPDGNATTFKSSTPGMDYGMCSSQAAAANINGQMWRQRPRTSSSSMAGYGGHVVTGVPVWCAYQQSS